MTSSTAIGVATCTPASGPPSASVSTPRDLHAEDAHHNCTRSRRPSSSEVVDTTRAVMVAAVQHHRGKRPARRRVRQLSPEPRATRQRHVAVPCAPPRAATFGSARRR
jgi:hypothetical protein